MHDDEMHIIEEHETGNKRIIDDDEEMRFSTPVDQHHHLYNPYDQR